VAIAFTVRSLVGIEREPDALWYRVPRDPATGKPVNVTNLVHGSGAPEYIHMDGSHAIIRLRRGGDLLPETRFTLDDCPAGGWADAKAPTADHPLPAATLPGIPAPLCPGS
jgi:hypothetical protein